MSSSMLSSHHDDSFIMGKLKVFEVVFNEEDPLYRAGDWVAGYVRLLLAQPKEGVRDETATDGNANKLVLHAGEQLFPFRFQIPATKPLPHAFEGYYGQVRYKVSAKIDRPSKKSYKTQKLFWMIGAGIDLNRRPQSVVPSTGADEKNVCCMSCVTGPIRVSTQTDKNGYVPGETIYISGFIQNESSREVIDVTAKLVQTVICAARREVSGRQHTRSQVREIAKVKCDGCEEYSKASFHRRPLVIASCPPTSLNGCGLIDVHYYVKISKVMCDGCDEYSKVSFHRRPLVISSCPPTSLNGCGLIDVHYYVKFDADIGLTPIDTYIYLPVTIGTVPLSNSTVVWTPRNGEVITQQPSATANPTQPAPRYGTSYEGLESIPLRKYQYTFGKLMYAPRYPVYDFPEPNYEELPCSCPDRTLYTEQILYNV